MSAQLKERRVAQDINIVYLNDDKPNNTNLKTKENRAVVAKLRADLVTPQNEIMTVDIDFDTTSGYHNNTMMLMDDYGVEMFASAIEAKHGKVHADKIRQAWNQKEDASASRLPTYMLVQKPKNDELPKVFAVCGKKGDDHISNQAPDSII